MKRLRIVLLIVITIIAAGSLYFLRQWYKPHRDAATEKGVVLSAPDLVKAYTSNEHASDSLYLNKTLELTGKVQEWGMNDVHQPTALLRSQDPMVGVFCTFKDTATINSDTGRTIVVKGICSGLVGDVKLTDCVLKQ